MKDLISVQSYTKGPSDYYIEWRLKLGGEEYGASMEVAAEVVTTSLAPDVIVETVVRQMNDSVQKILHGDTPSEREARLAQRLMVLVRNWPREYPLPEKVLVP